jgi:uncharacterized protein (TIGR02466 family)
MPNIELWFPVPIYVENNLFDKKQNKEWANHILSLKDSCVDVNHIWVGSTISSIQTNRMLDEKFDPLIKVVTSHVEKFAEYHQSYAKYECKNSWFNVNYKNTFQEFHCHVNNIFSAVYYVSAPKGSSNIIFEDPKEPDMFSVKESIGLPNRASYEAEEGKLIIFRSYLRHCVTQHKSNLPRISISFNFS